MTGRYSVEVIGDFDSSLADLAARLDEGLSPDAVSLLPGNFVAAITDARSSRRTLVASQSFAGQYFYYASKSVFAHGPTMTTIARQSGDSWNWDLPQVANYLSFGHVIGTTTIVREIRRIPRGTVVEWNPGALPEVRESTLSAEFDEQAAAPAGSPSVSLAQAAIQALTQAIRRSWKPDSTLCVTGGFDSRLLLAGMLAEGLRPRLFVAGQEGSFDLEVAEAISSRFRLELHRTSIEAVDFLNHAPTIADATSGMLPLAHWPGVLFAAKAPESQLYFGLNGEVARSYYFDRGFLAQALDFTPADWLGPTLLRSRAGLSATAKAQAHISRRLLDQFAPQPTAERLTPLFERGDRLGSVLDRAYRCQYGANKTGADLAAIGKFRSFSAPFFDGAWLRRIDRLPRSWKLGSRWHRYGIESLCPELLQFPEAARGKQLPHTTVRPSAGYWLRRMRNEAKHFFDQSIYADPALLEFIRPSFDSITELVAPTLLDEARHDRSARHLAFSFATIALWRKRLTDDAPWINVS